MAIKSTYHKSELMGTFSGERFYTTNQDLQKSDLVYVISSTGSGETLAAYLEGRFRVEKTVNGLFEIQGKKYEYESTLSEEIRPLKPIPLSDMRNKLGKRQFASRFMNVAKPILDQIETDSFNSLLDGAETKASGTSAGVEILEEDLNELLQSDTESAQLILARIGQGKFRRNVASVWGSRNEVCAVTGIALPAILTASHIVPWRECNGKDLSLRLEGANGILMCSNIDRLFDRYFLSFNKKGSVARIVYSKILTVSVLQQLQLTEDLELVPNSMISEKRDLFFSCMSRHYEKFNALESDR